MSSVPRLLAATRSSVSAERTSAESEITAYVQSNPHEFLQALLEIAGNPHSDIADAQSALMVLKTSITKYWSPGFEQFVGPPFSHETREFVRSGLMHLLAIVENSRVRGACASVISRIASLEYPDLWPSVIHQSVEFMSDSSNSTAMLGGLVLFRELLLETVREEDFMSYGQDILSMLHQIAQPVTTDGRRLLALQCFHECMTFLLMGDDDQMPHLEAMAETFIPQWCQLFAQILQEPGTFGEVDTVKEISESVNELDSAFPKVLEPLLPALFTVAVDVLETHQHAYDHGHSSTSSDRDEFNSSLSGLLMTILRNKEARKISLDSEAKVSKFTDLLVSLAVIPDPIAEWWADNFNEFVSADLELDLGDFSSRENAASLVGMTGQPLVLSRLLDLLNASRGKAAMEEALLFLLASLIGQVDIDDLLPMVSLEKLQILLNAVEFVEAADGSEPSPRIVLLVARKALAASQIAKYGGSHLPSNIKINLSTHPFKAPFSTNQSVRISQVRAAAATAALFPSNFQEFQTDLLTLIASLIEDAEDDTPGVLTECFGAVLKLDYNIVATKRDAVDMIFALASKDTSDVDLNAQILDVVGEILDAVPSREVVSQIMQPVLATISKGAGSGYEFSGDLYFTLDLATAVFEHEGVELSSNEREQMLQSFYNVITETEDPQILQAASFAYAALVKNIDGGISHEAAQNVLKVAAQLLNPDLTDSAALASGKLVTAIIEQFSSELNGSMLNELIDACAKRLITAKNALLVETLVIVFCELTLRNASAVVDLLSNSGMLEPVMKQWVPTFEVVRGAEEIHKNVRAFQLLFDLHDPRLAATILPDEPIRNPGEILTRRRAKNLKFTRVALPLKILKLLLKELAQAPKPTPEDDTQQALNATRRYIAGNGSDDSEDDWDDELALNDEGDALDLRLHGLILDWLKKIAHEPLSIEWLNQLNPDEQQFLLSLA